MRLPWPAMALSEPDTYGDMDFAFITTKQSRQSEHTLDIPQGPCPGLSSAYVKRFPM